MNRPIQALVLALALTLPAQADEKKTRDRATQDVAKDAKDARDAKDAAKGKGIPKGLQNFNGLLVGRLVEKDVEKGTFIVTVDRVSRVWRNSKAEKPKSIVGRRVRVEGVFGKWLDVLLLLKKGDTLEFESRHDGGETLTFPGELMRKVPPVKPGDYPELPEGFRGFQGTLQCKIVKKDKEMLELIVKVTQVKDTWKKNRAKKPLSIIGKRLILAGFWRHKKLYDELKKGDTIETGMKHISVRSDHLSIDEFVGKVAGKKVAKGEPEQPEKSEDLGDLPRGIRHFSGSLVGRLVEKDVEKGTFSAKVDRVARVWRNNKANNPKSVLGKTVVVTGVFGKFLDVLLLIRKGQTLQFECRHDGGPRLTFLGEGLWKVAPVKPGDYPELPDGSRGFLGAVTAKIVKKNKEQLELIVEVTGVKDTWKKNRAKKPEGLVGKKVMLAGFWRRRDAYDSLKVGDVIEVGLKHTAWHTDHLSVAEFIRKAGAKKDRAGEEERD